MGGGRQSVTEDSTLMLGSTPPSIPQKKPHKKLEFAGLEFKLRLTHTHSLVLGASLRRWFLLPDLQSSPSFGRVFAL